mgnify:CR=1 FL=1
MAMQLVSADASGDVSAPNVAVNETLEISGALRLPDTVCSDSSKTTEVACLYEQVDSGAALADTDANYLDPTACQAYAELRGDNYDYNTHTNNIHLVKKCFGFRHNRLSQFSHNSQCIAGQLL